MQYAQLRDMNWRVSAITAALCPLQSSMQPSADQWPIMKNLLDGGDFCDMLSFMIN